MESMVWTAIGRLGLRGASRGDGNRPKKIIDFYAPWSPTVTQEVTLKAAGGRRHDRGGRSNRHARFRGAKPGETSRIAPPKLGGCQASGLCDTSAPLVSRKPKKNGSEGELHLTKHASITDGWALEGRRGRGREGRGEASTVMVETHAWIVARSASGTSERAAGASCRLWERRWERATRCMY